MWEVTCVTSRWKLWSCCVISHVHFPQSWKHMSPSPNHTSMFWMGASVRLGPWVRRYTADLPAGTSEHVVGSRKKSLVLRYNKIILADTYKAAASTISSFLLSELVSFSRDRKCQIFSFSAFPEAMWHNSGQENIREILLVFLLNIFYIAKIGSEEKPPFFLFTTACNCVKTWDSHLSTEGTWLRIKINMLRKKPVPSSDYTKLEFVTSKFIAVGDCKCF